MLTLWYLARGLLLSRRVAVELHQQLTNCWDVLGVELVSLGWVDGDTDAARARVNTERCFKQMVAMLRHLGVDARICVLQNDIFAC